MRYTWSTSAMVVFSALMVSPISANAQSGMCCQAGASYTCFGPTIAGFCGSPSVFVAGTNSCGGFVSGTLEQCLGAVTSLPVELSSFDAVVDGRDVRLRWTTASETDNAGFSVEREVGSDVFVEVGFVHGRGTTDELNEYDFVVSDLSPGVHRFRLKQIDFDGVFEYSRVTEASVEVPGTFHLVEANPNPFSRSTEFSVTVANGQHVRVDLYEATGRHVRSVFTGIIEANRPTSFDIEAGDLPSGLYVYRVVGEQFVESKSVILLR